MKANLIITGVGGQGNVMASQIIGHAAVSAGKKVFIGETFGLSQRGGPVMSHVRIADDMFIGPLIAKGEADIILGIEPLEALRVLQEFGSKNTTVITNSRPVYPINVIAGDTVYPEHEEIKKALDAHCNKLYWLNLTKSALELGSPILLNTILLGALSKLEEFPLSNVDLTEALENVLPLSKLEVNKNALTVGYDSVQ